MIIVDWIFAILIFGFIGAVVFAGLLQGVGLIVFMAGHGHPRPQTEQRVSVRVHHYDMDDDEV